ncbi:MAG: biotin carboxylase, partial [Thermoleophilia bacterium]|nr:biotin carboxylase [Thermoleophilia bacterium]
MPEPSPRILVTGAGGPAALGLMRSLEASDIDIYAADIDPFAQGLYHVPAERRLILPRGDDPDFAYRLRVECLARKISLLVPTVEVELAALAGSRQAFRRDGVELMAPGVEALRRCLDKWRLFESLDGHEYLPRTRLLDSRFDPWGWQFPTFVKPRRGSGST